MRFFPLALLGLASVAVAADPKSWDDLVGDVPSCIKGCLGDFYDNLGLQNKCGSSDSASVDCLCSAKFSTENASDNAKDLATCFNDKCSASEFADSSKQLQDFLDRIETLQGQCTKNSASSIAPGLNAMIASGALILVGATL